MPITWTDASSGTQRLAGDNSFNVNLGTGTPAAPLSVMGVPVVTTAGKLAGNSVSSTALIRYSGSITVAAAGTASVTGIPVAGLGSIDQGGLLTGFTIGSGFAVANPNQTTSKTFNYAVM